MEEFVIGSLVIMSDDNEYCVVDKFNENGREYIYLVDTNLGNKNVFLGKIEGDNFVELTDKDEIDMFLKKVYEHTYNNEFFENIINKK